MKSNEEKELLEAYVKPEVSVVEFELEGVIASSAPNSTSYVDEGYMGQDSDRTSNW